jgi:hypothetical protein
LHKIFDKLVFRTSCAALPLLLQQDWSVFIFSLEHIKVVMTERAVLIILQQRLNPVRGELVEP